MPRGKRRTGLDAAIAKATEEFAAKIRGLISDEVANSVAGAEDKLARIQAALGVEPPTKRKPSKAPKATTAKRRRRRKRVSAAEVQEAALDALAAKKEPVGMAVLVSATGYSQTQLRSALAGLVDGGDVRRDGERRSTTYQVAGRTVAKKTTAKKKATTKRKVSKKTASRKKATATKKPNPKKKAAPKRAKKKPTKK